MDGRLWDNRVLLDLDRGTRGRDDLPLVLGELGGGPRAPIGSKGGPEYFWRNAGLAKLGDATLVGLPELERSASFVASLGV